MSALERARGHSRELLRARPLVHLNQATTCTTSYALNFRRQTLILSAVQAFPTALPAGHAQHRRRHLSRTASLLASRAAFNGRVSLSAWRAYWLEKWPEPRHHPARAHINAAPHGEFRVSRSLVRARICGVQSGDEALA